MNLREVHISEQSLQNCDPVQQTEQLLKENTCRFQFAFKVGPVA